MKRDKIIYWVATGLLSAMMLLSGSMYIIKNADVSAEFATLGFPTYIVYPLAIAKMLGIVAILTKQSAFLKEWAYAGFFFNFTMAFLAHLMAGDGKLAGPIVALLLLTVSYIFDKRVFA